MTKESDMDHPDLDEMFAQARATLPLGDEALLARVYSDSLRMQPKPKPSVPRTTKGSSGWWVSLVNNLGGKRGLAGLGTAAVAGVMLGIVDPTSVLALTDTFFAASTVDEVDLMPGFDAILTEG